MSSRTLSIRSSSSLLAIGELSIDAHPIDKDAIAAARMTLRIIVASS
jgi:hypothetical protein